MIRPSNSVFPALLALLFLAGARAPMAEDGLAGAGGNQDWRQTFGLFSVAHILTGNPEQFVRTWDLTIDGKGYGAPSAITRDRAISSFIVFRGCSAGTDGNCRLVASYRVTGPGGEAFAAYGPVSIWSRGAVMAQSALQLGDRHITIRFTEQDPAGPYRVTATVKDLNSGYELKVSQHFLLQ